MNNFVFENQGTNTYLIYTISPEDVVDSMSLGMLTNNKIPGLAATVFTQMDTLKYIKYNVSAKITVKQFFSGAVNKARLIGVFSSIVDGLMFAEDYMLDANSILLNLDYIFADVSTCEASLICLPITNAEMGQNDFGNFFKNIMFTTQFDQTENCDYVAKIMNFLNSSPVFSLPDFKRLLEEVKKGVVVPQSKAQNSVQPKPVVSSQPKIESQPIAENKPSGTVQKKLETSQPAPVTPPQSQIVQPAVQQSVKSVPHTEEKKMSMFGLLMHYSKENAELYKAQKAAKKGRQPQNIKPDASVKQNQTSFAVPGAPNNPVSFAVPGQPVSTPVAPASPVVASPSQIQTKTSSVSVQQPAYTAPKAPQGKSANFGETTVLGGGLNGETTVLSGVQNPAQVVAPHLIRMKNSERIPLNKPVFRIGKERSYVDYFIADNTAISRSHANFITRDDKYYVVDTNSTNHTYINGKMIQSNAETEITHGDTVRLANEDFELKLY